MPLPIPSRSSRRAFTLVEIMVVVGIIAVVIAIAIPNIHRLVGKDTESMQGVLKCFLDACNNARATAIMNGTPTDLVVKMISRQVEVAPGQQVAER